MSEDRAQARAIEADHPGWQAVALTGWYARRPRSSPPIVVKAPTLAGLREAIAARDAR
ncbi:MAG TPA: hypothetical protein VMV17_17570 [Streptosporangiaceae bacterium]|nr:hypothetical protein [Streptosporangiaceae bacterium]